MRGGRRPRGGSARFVSPKPWKTSATAKVKDHRSDGRRNPFPQRPRRSVSPPVQSRARRSPGRGSSSIERKDFASRRAEHGKQPLHENDHSGNRPTLFEDESYEFQHKYMLPDYSADPILDVNRGSKLPRAMKDIDFHSQGSGSSALASSGISRQSMLLQKSIFSDDGSARSFFTLPPGTDYLSSATALNSESRGNGIGNLNVGIRNNQMHHYDDRIIDSYDGKDKDKAYPRDVTFPLISSSQTRPFSGTTSSSGLVPDDLLGLYRDRLDHPSDGFCRGGVSNFLGDPFERKGYSQVQLSDPMRRAPPPLSPPARDGPRDYGSHELGRNERGDHGVLAANGEYKEMPWGHRGHFKDTLSSSFMDLAGDRAYRTDVSQNNFSDSCFWDKHRSLRGDAVLDYRDTKMVHEDYIGGSGSGRVGFRMKSARDHELVPFEERDALGRDAVPIAYRERPRSPLISENDMDMYRQGGSPPRGASRMDGFGTYDLPSERMNRREYVMNDDETETDSRGLFSNDTNVFRRIQSGSDEVWSNEDRVVRLPSKKLAFGHPPHRMSARRVSDACVQPVDSSVHAEGGRDMSLKRRLRPGASEFHGSFYSERRNDSFRPHKFWKRSLEDRQGWLDAHDGDTLDDDVRLAKTDPPEDSEEFKHQVHKAFLRFSKLLNESPHQQRRYRDQGKAGNLLCGVCGSNSKLFVDTHSLVTHTYNSFKVGLRTEHLGLHKAICVLMGWNWLIVPENSKGYQSRPAAEAKALKEDLILWPPLVIIHNSSIGNKNNTDGTKLVTIEGVEEILRDMGFGSGKIRVSRGRPANQSVFLLKFMPTFSGLREAERLHEHYADKKRGRQEFQQIISCKSSSSSSSDCKVGEAQAEKMEELLYGYMAVAEDLDKLDPETKKRSMVKSKKDIEAIADAPLNTD